MWSCPVADCDDLEGGLLRFPLLYKKHRQTAARNGGPVLGGHHETKLRRHHCGPCTLAEFCLG